MSIYNVYLCTNRNFRSGSNTSTIQCTYSYTCSSPITQGVNILPVTRIYHFQEFSAELKSFTQEHLRFWVTVLQEKVGISCIEVK